MSDFDRENRIYPLDGETVTRIFVETITSCAFRLLSLAGETKYGRCAEEVWRCAQVCRNILKGEK